MTLSTTPSSAGASPRVTVEGTVPCAVVCAASAGVHGGLVAPHAVESTRMAVAFALAALALAAAAVAEVLTRTPLVSAAVAGLLLAVATAYLLSRTTGIPGLTEHQEPFDTFGTVVSLLEVAAAVMAGRQSNPRRQ